MKLDDGFGALRAGRHANELALERGDLLQARVGWCGLRAASLRQRGEFAATHGRTPGGKMRRVEPFTSQQGTELASLRALGGRVEDLPLIRGGELAAGAGGRHPGIVGEYRRGSKSRGHAANLDHPWTLNSGREDVSLSLAERVPEMAH